VKYIILKTFMIESGDDEEERLLEPSEKPQQPKQESKPVANGAYVFPDRFKKYAGQTINDQNIKEVEGYFNYLMSGAKNPADPMLMALAEAIAKFKKPVRTTPDITEKDVPF
jgi:hypothetical protein